MMSPTLGQEIPYTRFDLQEFFDPDMEATNKLTAVQKALLSFAIFFPSVLRRFLGPERISDDAGPGQCDVRPAWWLCGGS